jgi:hypothetical protein
MFTVLEPLLGIINCSLPVLRPVGQKIFARFDKADALHSRNTRRTPASPVLSIGTQRRAPKALDPYYLDLATIHTLDDGSEFELCSISQHNTATGACSRNSMEPYTAC